MTVEINGLETLDIWQKAVDFAVDVCKNVIPCFPAEEKWALSSQLRRSVQSIPANIAEGYGRYPFQESIHFCYIARGSVAESKTHLVMTQRLGDIDEAFFQSYLQRLIELGKMLQGYIKHLYRQNNRYSVKKVTEVKKVMTEGFP